MCGIVGYISKQKYELKPHLNQMRHRGPDASGTFYTDNIGLGHVRLSIVDTGRGANQPYILDNQDYVIIFNGEIYNFKILREILINKGYIFSTESDTEVLLKMYIEFGLEMFSQLDGMFAFSIFDKSKNSLIIARDHLGIKPIYYHIDKIKREFYFASELSTLFEFPIKKEFDEKALTEFLFNGWLYEPNTAFSKVYKVFPGEYIQINLDNFEINKEIYFDISDKKNIAIPTKDIDDIIYDSIQLQSYNEVQIGNFFSGGIDSTVIATLIDQEIHNLTVSYNKADLAVANISDDAHYAKKIGDILNLNIDYITMSNLLEPLEQIKYVAENTEDLISDFTFLASEAISEEAAERDYKIMLSGMGADELFCGYQRYNMVKYEYFYKFISVILQPFYLILKRSKTFSKRIERFYSYLNAKSFAIGYSHIIGFYTYDEISSMVKDKKSIKVYENKVEKLLNRVKGVSRLKKAMYLDLYGYLSHNFSIADKSSMLHSIELRVPLVTKNILEKLFYGKDSELISFRKTKLSLRNILYKFIPEKIVDRKKVGFNPPLDKMIKDIGKEEIEELLEESPLKEYMDFKYFYKIVEEHFLGNANNTYKIFQIIYLHYWLVNVQNKVGSSKL